MLKNIAVENCVLVADTGVGDIKISSPASLNVKAENKGVYFGVLNITITGLSGTYEGVSFSNGSGTGTLTGSAQFTNVDNKPVALEGDKSVTIPVVAQIPNPPYTMTIPTIVTIQSAGQTACKAE